MERVFLFSNRMKRIVIQGIKGSYHEQAVNEYFGNEEVEVIAGTSFKQLFRALAEDSSLYGMVAIENTIAGSLLQNYDFLCQSDLEVIGEHKLRISHCLAALPGETIESIAEISSHPIALRQCEDFLSTFPSVKISEADDTASAARFISTNQASGRAAICSRRAAEEYGLDILAEAVETNKRNFTRFLLLADRWVASQMPKCEGANKSTLVFSLPHHSGSLSKILTILSFYDMNLTKIQSLPIIGREWEYQFYADVTFSDRTRFQQSIEAIRPLTMDLRILGQYIESPFPTA